jgi:hypothetical protein
MPAIGALAANDYHDSMGPDSPTWGAAMSAERNGRLPTDDNWIPACHLANRAQVSAEEISKHNGEFVAWSWDGTRIIASGASYAEVYARLDEQGVPVSRAVISYVDPPDSL